MGFAAWARSFVAAAPADAPQLAVEAEEDPKPAKTGWFSKSEPKKAAPADRAAALGADALAEAEIYWQDLEGTARGPCSWAEYKAAIFDGDVGPESLVRAPGVLDAFTRVGDVPALAALVPTRARGAPPSAWRRARPADEGRRRGRAGRGDQAQKSLLSKMVKAMSPKSPKPAARAPRPAAQEIQEEGPAEPDVALRSRRGRNLLDGRRRRGDGPPAWAEYKAAYSTRTRISWPRPAPGVLYGGAGRRRPGDRS